MSVLIKMLKTILFIFVGLPMGICFWIFYKIGQFIEDYVIYDIKRIWKGEI